MRSTIEGVETPTSRVDSVETSFWSGESDDSPAPEVDSDSDRRSSVTSPVDAGPDVSVDEVDLAEPSLLRPRSPEAARDVVAPPPVPVVLCSSREEDGL